MKLWRRKAGLLAIAAVFFLQTGAAQYQKVKVLEGADVLMPYEKLGTLQVQAESPIPRPGSISWLLLYGLFDPLYGLASLLTAVVKMDLKWSFSQEGYLKIKLDKQLADTARKHYGADAVVNVRYWPLLDSSSFPKGTIYARGDMIRYLPFEEGLSGEMRPEAV